MYNKNSVFFLMFVLYLLDSDTQQDMFDKAGDEELGGDEEEESQWRMERYEREKFLQDKMVPIYIFTI